jgi:hypothetical protein
MLRVILNTNAILQSTQTPLNGVECFFQNGIVTLKTGEKIQVSEEEITSPSDFKKGDFVYYCDQNNETSPTQIEKASKNGRFLIETFDFRKIWVTSKNLKHQTYE